MLTFLSVFRGISCNILPYIVSSLLNSGIVCNMLELKKSVMGSTKQKYKNNIAILMITYQIIL